jgi:hypothetical protein
MRKHLTYANVMVTLLAFIVLAGGAAYAANTIGSTDIINGQVKSVDIGNGQVQSVDVKNDGLTGDGRSKQASGLRSACRSRPVVRGGRWHQRLGRIEPCRRHPGRRHRHHLGEVASKQLALYCKRI